MYLIDTVVLSELRKRQRDSRLAAWVGFVPEPVFDKTKPILCYQAL